MRFIKQVGSSALRNINRKAFIIPTNTNITNTSLAFIRNSRWSTTTSTTTTINATQKDVDNTNHRVLISSKEATNVLREMTIENLLQHAKYIQNCLPSLIQQVSLYKEELTLYVPPTAIPKVCEFLRDNTATQYKQMIDIAGVDFPEKENRFEVVYHFLSVRYNTRIRVKTYCAELGSVPSITPLFPAANWFEREAWDMYGIFFTGHPDLRRILTDYGFNGHPLRKDFPLTGYVQVRYDEEKKRVVSEPLDMAQQFRFFDYQSPWEQVGPGEPVKVPTKEAPAANPAPSAEKKL